MVASSQENRTMTKTYSDIINDIALLDEHLAVSEEAASRLAYDAVVTGSADAAKEISRLNAEIRRAKSERKTVVAAAEVARQREAEAREAVDAASIAAALGEARSAAQRLVEKAEAADALVIELTDTISEIASLERVVHSHLRAARTTPPGALIGRNGLSFSIVERLSAIVRGDRARLPTMKTAVDTACIGWAFILNDEDK
ncbi:hypothetical protein [Rhizobium sp. AB2/73]|uniref:hypothetical protein n=1 Tax=Rhizobium sp. AB2/73 TaxID=2795216 RepID=UPI000DDDFFE9|nr:hypothetical protein [Rhizobium sp. AB2/73]QYA11716.1 hypothetical protein J5284_14385 [Rhizobium sp. AB2/73]UEQ82354.1 hypothetical protein I8E17_07620 [Rhizobium sp. AB2/73]